MRALLWIFGLSIIAGTSVACNSDQPDVRDGRMERAGEKIDDAIDDAREKIEDTVDKAGRKTDRALDKAGDKIQEATDE